MSTDVADFTPANRPESASTLFRTADYTVRSDPKEEVCEISKI